MNKRTHKLKNAVLPIAALLLAASCSESPSGDDSDARPIRFGSSVPTRSAVNSESDLQQDGSAFSVWGWHTTADGAGLSQAFDAEKVSWASGAWGYDNVKFWLTGRTYDFYALYPSVDKLGEARITCSQDGRLAIDNFDATGSNDLMIASQSGITPQANQDPGPVSFGFEHQLAKLQFQVKAVGRNLTVTSFKLNGVACKADFAHTAGTGSTWSNPVLSSANDNYFAATDIPVTTSTPVDMLGDVLVPPHDALTDVQVEISYRYDFETTDRTATVSLANLTAQQWEAGQQYAYTLNISTADLTIQVSVLDWEEQNTSVSW